MPLDTYHRTIKEARAELRDWGKFWAKQYGLSGSGSVMNEFIRSQRRRLPSAKRKYKFRGKGQIRSNACRGIDIPVEANCTPTRTVTTDHQKEVFVPWWLQGLDDFIESLQEECRSALRTKYIEKSNSADGYWLDTAERLVMNRI